MRQNQLHDFKKDVKAGLSLELLSERYDLPEKEILKGIHYLTRNWLERLYIGFRQLFTNIIFQARIKFLILKIRKYKDY